MRPILDGHNDALLRMQIAVAAGQTPSLAAGLPGHVDVAKARAGGMGGGFFACFAPAVIPPPPRGVERGPDGWELPYPPPLDPAEALRSTLAMVARLHAAEAEGSVRIVRAIDELEPALAAEPLAAILHLEGCEAIGPDLDVLHVLHAAGLRSLGPVWSRANVFATGVPLRFPSPPDVGPGLTDAGRALVDRCGELGVLVDLSHLNERGFWDVAARATAPLVATHSACHALTPTARNLTDAQLDAIGASGGVVGINLNCCDLRADGADDPDTPLTRWCEHAEHVAERIGPEAVAIGSDLDGATMPDAVRDASGLSRLLDTLAGRGWTAAQLDGVAAGNFVRVLHRTWHP